ncbi:uncharacterized protein LOC133778989 [Humulus lupulus]|uniref:uncharacterized protein LOC133778989 n=1 Tax=Humulus lupulus TaxID=3486 RepID=UPI002B4177E6|nr:uncharacterized protein LOC133778989 [Humulus lupulus]
MSDRCQPFLQCIKKSTNTTWGPEQQKALDELKTYLSSPPILSSPIANEDLSLYLSVSRFAYDGKIGTRTPHGQKEVTTILRKPHDHRIYGLSIKAVFAAKILLADFLVEIQSFTPDALPELLESEDQWLWTMYTDGASNSQGAGIGVVLEAPSGLKIEEAIRLEQSAMNNEAEYEALIYGLELAREMGIQRLNFELILVPREQNQKADALAKLASAGGCTRQSSISISRSSKNMEVYSTSSEPECWIDLIIKYLTTSELPPNPKDAKLLRLRAQRYSMIHGTLYRKSFNGPYLRCLRPSEAKKLLEEIHEGTCGNHTGGRSLAHKALTAGYYWSYMMTEARDYAKKCDKCQRFAPTIHQPAQTLHSIIAPWPFAKWGMDVVGELPKAAGGRRYALVATDYFTKWVVAEAYVTVSKTDTMSFIWTHIICQFGIPWEIVVDNGTPFQNAKVQELCDTYKIKLSFASVTYPQGNG